MRPARIRIVMLGVAVGILASGAALASIPTQPGVPVAAQPEESTALAGTVEISRLLDMCAQRLHVSVVYDAAALKAAGAVTLRLGGPLSDEELWALTNRLLAERGLTTVRLPGAVGFSVVKLAEAPARTEVLGLGDAGPPDGFPVGPLSHPPGSPAGVSFKPGPGFVAVSVRAQHRPAKELIDAVTKVLSKPGGSAQALGDSGLILIADLSPTVDQALTLLRAIDTEGPAAAVVEVPVQNLAAATLATLVAQVSAKRELVSGEKTPGEVIASPNGNAVLVVAPEARVEYWRGLVASLDRRERVETVTYTPRLFGAAEVAKLVEDTVRDHTDDRWRLVADELTGVLIVSATPSQHEQVAALIARLDSAPAAAQRPARSYVIKNRPVGDIQAILEQMVSTGVIGSAAAEPAGASTAPTSGSPVTPTPPPQGTAPWPPSPSPPSGTAAGTPRDATRTTFSPPSRQPAYGAKRQEPAVQFTSDDGTNTLIAMGEPRVLAQIEVLLKALDVRQAQVMLEVLIVSLSDSQTLDLGVELDKRVTAGDTLVRLSSLFGIGFRGPGGDRAVGDGAGFTGLVLSPGDFSVVLRALQTLNKGRSLSMPRLLVANNQQATLDSTLSQPYANTNASNTVTTTSYGGTQDAGTQVTLKPQIGAGDHLNLDYSISLSAFVGAAASPNVPPPRQQNKVQSAASIPDGYTVAVGGIELTSEGQGTSQVPGLGSIPILGEAFKSRSRTASRSRFFVFIRASVQRNESYEDLKYLSDVAVRNAGVDDGWPVLEPRVMR